MICLLCLCVERDEHLLDVASAESRQLNIASILHTHFGFCFEELPEEGSVCQKCWVKVSVFHEFYTHIECVHRSNEKVFAECIVDEIKPSVDSESDNWEFPPEEETFNKSVDEKPKNALFRKKTRRPKSESTESEVSSSDDNRDSYGKSNINSEDVRTRPSVLGTENQQTWNIDDRPMKKRGRPRKDEQRKSDDAIRVVSAAELTHELNINNEPMRKRGRPRKDDPVKPRSNKCNRCSLGFPSFRSLSRHIKVVHVVLPFKCKHARCVESFATQQDQDEHFATKHKQTECPQCKKMFLESTIGQHIRMQHQTNDDQVICDLCGKISSTLSKQKAHYRKMHEVQSKVQCDICKEWTKHKESLRRHMIRMHIYGPQTCTICGHTSPNRNALREHSKMHMPDFKTRWKCVHCGRGFRDKMSLAEHSHIHTGFAGQYHCKDCGKVFRFNSSYYIHRKKMHPK